MDLTLNHVTNTTGSEMNDLESPWSVQQLVEHFLNTSKCYDLMQTSSKVSSKLCMFRLVLYTFAGWYL
ncbi:hypothetical protein EON65_08395 [archaeon]|nr:MAG: hypothetical protein EON65_08395 [archaeon]